MNSGAYTAEVTSLSPRATDKDVYTFFAHCGLLENVEIIRSGESACTAYVTFTDAYALETALLLSGATIVDQRVCITRWGTYIDECDPWNNRSANFEGNPSATSSMNINKIGLTDKINASVELLKSVDEKYRVSEMTKSAASVTGSAAVATGRSAAAAANAFVNSQCFASGALWVSDVLSRASKAAADLGTRPRD